MKDIQQLVTNASYHLPDLSSQYPETAAFKKSFDEINQMLSGEKPLSLKRAVFLAENAYFNEQASYEEFERAIRKKARLALRWLRENNFDANDPDNRRMSLFKLMADTLRFQGYEGEEIHYPYTYDFEDFYGRKDRTKQFVSKLLATKNGQCHSLPLLYLILAEELGVTAYLSTAPEHYYIRIQDRNGAWYNLELTNNMITSPSHILGSGFIKSEALRNRIYMDTLGQRKQVLTCLTDLAQNYVHKFGYDDFVKECTSKVLEENPKDMHAMLVQASYYGNWFEYVRKKFNIQTETDIKQHPQAIDILFAAKKMFKFVDATGYEPIPEASYQAWLNSMKSEIDKQRDRELRKSFQLKEIR